MRDQPETAKIDLYRKIDADISAAIIEGRAPSTTRDTLLEFFGEELFQSYENGYISFSEAMLRAVSTDD